MADQALKRGSTAQPVPKTAFWNNPDVRAIVYQVAMIAAVLGLAAYLVYNTMSNLEARSIRSGFGFLEQEAGFYIGEHPISFKASDSYGRAFVVGILNTLRVAVIGIVLATLIGTVVGIARLSKNWLIAKLASVYVESVRNVPLLLQLYFWYQIIVGVLPPVRNALHVMPGVYLSASGLNYAVPVAHPAHWGMLVAFIVGAVVAYFYRRWAADRQAETGQQAPLLWPILGLILGLPFLAWLVGGAPTTMNVPTMGTFRFTGGSQVTPEFMA
ncbi:MAG: ABC transporter permease subunit, partial [Methyloceanibacter sp.]